MKIPAISAHSRPSPPLVSAELTLPGKNWFAYSRFYNPTEAYFDRSWPLPDFAPI